jgi:hypothetical protein
MKVLDYPAGTAKRNCEHTSDPPPNVPAPGSSKGYHTTSICFRSAGGVPWAPIIPT